MNTLPLFFNLHNKTVLIVGGGDVAHRKAVFMAKAQARMVVIAKQFDEEFIQFLNQNAITYHQKLYEPSDLDTYQPAIVIGATDDHAVNVALHGDCQARGIAINVVDTPKLCDFIFPAIVDRDPVVIGVSSNGKAPVLARLIRAKIESSLPSSIGKLAAKAGEFRAKV